LKLGAGLVAYPVWAGLLVTAAAWLSRSPAWLAALCAVILVSPFVALFWIERTRGLTRAARVVTQRRRLPELARKRAHAIELLARARAELAPAETA
jgi:hypothetical protein